MGLLLLSAALLLTLYNIWDSHRAGEAAQEAASSLKTMLSAPVESTQVPTASEPELPTQTPEATEEEVQTEPEETPLPYQQREMPTMELNGYDYIGVLEAPSLELTLPVMDRWDYERLKISPCRFSGKVYEDDLVICAHN